MSTFRNFTLSLNWILDKEDRYTMPGHKTGTVHEVRTIGVSLSFCADDALGAEAPTVHSNVHLTGVVRDKKTGKKIKGLDFQDNEDFTYGLPRFIQDELDNLWKVRTTLWQKSQGPAQFTQPV